MTFSKLINCPFCQEPILAKFLLKKEGMSRFYAYCKDCKCSILKTIRRGEE